MKSRCFGGDFRGNVADNEGKGRNVKLIRRSLLVAIPALLGLTLLAGAASASTDTNVSTGGTARVPCSVSPGHYCAKIIYTSAVGGIRLNATKSTGYTRGPGRGREYFRYSCTSGTCYIRPTPIVVYTSADIQLNVNRFFTGAGKFLPCGNVFGVQYINPNVNAPAPPVLFQVTCGAKNGIKAA